jgi:hypothetical protein
LISVLGEEPALNPVNLPLLSVFNNISATTDLAEL